MLIKNTNKQNYNLQQKLVSMHPLKFGNNCSFKTHLRIEYYKHVSTIVYSGTAGINSETICAAINEICAIISAILCSNNYIFSRRFSFATPPPRKW
jgi:hypothetical protein